MPRQVDKLSPAKLRGPEGWVLAIIYSVAILGVAYSALPSGQSAATILTSTTGAAATAMVLVQFVTSGRFEWISGKIGLDVTMGFHRIAAAGLVLLVFVHIAAVPFQNGLPGVPTRLLLRLDHIFSRPGNLTGLIAYGLLIALFITAKWLRGKVIPYEIWRITHGAASILIVLLVLDHVLRQGENVFKPLPATLLSLLVVAAAASFAVVYIFRPRQSYGRGFVVEKTRRLSPTVVKLTLKSSNRCSFSFEAGQFAWIALNGRHPVTDNPFSIASGPEDLPHLTFLIREAGDMTKGVMSLAPGTKVAVDGPYGNFVERMGATAIVLVAGGIGIAPILSILKAAASRGDSRPYQLIYAVRTAEELVAMDDLSALYKGLNLKIDIFVETGSTPQGAHSGRLSTESLASLTAGLDCTKGLVFLCGPPAMMDVITGALINCGFPAKRVIAERFDYDAAQDPISKSVRLRFVAVLTVIGAGLALAAFI